MPSDHCGLCTAAGSNTPDPTHVVFPDTRLWRWMPTLDGGGTATWLAWHDASWDGHPTPRARRGTPKLFVWKPKSHLATRQGPLRRRRAGHLGRLESRPTEAIERRARDDGAIHCKFTRRDLPWTQVAHDRDHWHRLETAFVARILRKTPPNQRATSEMDDGQRRGRHRR